MYKPVIGLEVHVELNTKSKMFCKDSADYFGKSPNSHVCPICLGLPGSLPFVNGEAIDKCIAIGLALNCQIIKEALFERKNYFYPDLAKGYQISQYRWPLCRNGWIEVSSNQQKKKIKINRVHQEEDTGKLTHIATDTLIDFNRSGVPLVEIVTEPDFEGSDQVRDYAQKLQQLMRYLNVSNADMEKGDMRLEANVSVKVASDVRLPSYRVELKNINSFRFLVAAIDYEIQRQIKALEKGEKLNQETRGWDESKRQTYIQRVKEAANDYRYFPEPDLPYFKIDQLKVQRIKDQLPELPWIKLARFVKDYDIGFEAVRILTEDKGLANFFEESVVHGKKHDLSAKQIANFIINKRVSIDKVLPTQIVEEILGKKIQMIADVSELEKLSKEAIKENPKMVKDYKKGKSASMQALIGMVMRKSLGKADPAKLADIFKKLFKKS